MSLKRRYLYRLCRVREVLLRIFIFILILIGNCFKVLSMGVCICIDVCVIRDLIFFLKEFFGCSVGGGWDGNGGVVRKLVRDGGKLD